MVASFRVFKKISPNGKLTLYLGKRDFVDHLVDVDPIGNKPQFFCPFLQYYIQWNGISSYLIVDGVITIDPDYLQDRKVFVQLVCSFRYGREEDEMMGLRSIE